jgi:hypothetical protein
MAAAYHAVALEALRSAARRSVVPFEALALPGFSIAFPCVRALAQKMIFVIVCCLKKNAVRSAASNRPCPVRRVPLPPPHVPVQPVHLHRRPVNARRVRSKHAARFLVKSRHITIIIPSLVSVIFPNPKWAIASKATLFSIPRMLHLI